MIRELKNRYGSFEVFMISDRHGTSRFRVYSIDSQCYVGKALDGGYYTLSAAQRVAKQHAALSA